MVFEKRAVRQKEAAGMSDKIYSIPEIRAIAAPMAERRSVSALYLFGSYARSDASPGA